MLLLPCSVGFRGRRGSPHKHHEEAKDVSIECLCQRCSWADLISWPPHSHRCETVIARGGLRFYCLWCVPLGSDRLLLALLVSHCANRMGACRDVQRRNNKKSRCNKRPSARELPVPNPSWGCLGVDGGNVKHDLATGDLPSGAAAPLHAHCLQTLFLRVAWAPAFKWQRVHALVRCPECVMNKRGCGNPPGEDAHRGDTAVPTAPISTRILLAAYMRVRSCTQATNQHTKTSTQLHVYVSVSLQRGFCYNKVNG